MEFEFLFRVEDSRSSAFTRAHLRLAGSKYRCGLLQVEKSPKPVASCAMPAGPGMNIKTDTPLVKKAREGVMEFLLVCLCVLSVLFSWSAKHSAIEVV